MHTEITPKQLAERLKTEPNLKLVDVREPSEFAVCRIEGSINIPLGSLGDHLPGIDPGETVILICRVGRRSTVACQRLVQHHGDLLNLTGGMEWWCTEGLRCISD